MTDDATLTAAIETCLAAGLSVTSSEPSPWVTPSRLYRSGEGHPTHYRLDCRGNQWPVFSNRFGTKARFFSRLRHPDCPHFQKHLGLRRIIDLRPTPELIAWLERPSHPGRKV